ncbi:hypothetical protein Tco_0420352 [Tanacetum coccineum]
MNDLQILKGIQLEKEKQAAQGFIPYWNFSMIDDEEARDNFLKDVCTFLRKFSHALMDKQYRQEDIQELMSKLLEDVRNISEELSEYINCPSWNRPLFYDYDDDEYTIIYSKPKTITPDLLIEEPDNSLIMGDEHLNTILETESDEIIKSSIEILVPIPSEFEGISDDTCDVPVCEDPSTFDVLRDHFEILSDSNNDGTSSNDNDFEDIEYVSLEEVNDVDQEKKEFDLEDILQIQDVILCEKLLNINRVIANIESLNDNPSPNRVFNSRSLIHIPITDSDSFFEEFDTSLSHLDNSLPEFKTFSDHTEERELAIEPDQERSTSVVISDNLNDPLLELLEFESFHFDLHDDPSFPRPPSEPPDVEICLNFEPDTPVLNNFDELNEDECFDPGGGYSDFEDSRAHGFVHSYIRASYPQLHLGNPIS